MTMKIFTGSMHCTVKYLRTFPIKIRLIFIVFITIIVISVTALAFFITSIPKIKVA